MLAFREAFGALERRIKIFTSLPIDKLGRLALAREVAAIGRQANDALEGQAS